jgi:hypothetical protein
LSDGTAAAALFAGGTAGMQVMQLPLPVKLFTGLSWGSLFLTQLE